MIQLEMVEIHRPDGKNDILQQIEHGALSIVAGYQNLGRLYRGIIENNLRQYVHLGDAATMTDGRKYNPALKNGALNATESGVLDDRLVFTENNPMRELTTARCLAASSRALKGFNDTLSVQCLNIARALYNSVDNNASPWIGTMKLGTAVELFLTRCASTWCRWRGTSRAHCPTSRLLPSPYLITCTT
jgi:hypothetical protein